MASGRIAADYMRLLAPLRLVVRVGRRFVAERMAQTIAALSFATLLGLVPMIIVAASLIDQVPFTAGIGAALEEFLLANLLPEKAGAVIAKVVGQFANRADRVTMIGILALAATALMQMLTIEHAFNAIWKIKAPRSLLRRLAIHGLALVLGPLLFGVSLAATTYLASVSLGLIAEAPWLTTLVFRTLSFGFVAGLFAMLYWGVPNRAVSGWHAAVGGTLAAAGFLAMQRLFGLYIVKFPTYTLVYGPFAAMPIFLIWLYASWTVILVGALVTAELPRAAKASPTAGRNPA
ncbi:MAG TPA: YihY family inner membrane protein [Rhodocyclaceae bacterium]|nr:YihY family inner membrane protein [Rhodocyclaceae bacterium]